MKALLLCFGTWAALSYGDVEDPVATEAWVIALLQFVTTAKGLTALAFAAGVTQLLMKLLQTPLAQVAGRWRLVAVSAFSVASVVLGALAAGIPMSAAMASGPILAAVQVFLNQCWRQFFTEKGNLPAAVVGK